MPYSHDQSVVLLLPLGGATNFKVENCVLLPQRTVNHNPDSVFLLRATSEVRFEIRIHYGSKLSASQEEILLQKPHYQFKIS